MKRIGLVIAAAMLGTTGVASAGIAVHQFAASTSANSESVKLDAKTAGLAADCWIATGAGKAANCQASASPALPGAPGLDDVTKLVDAQGLIETAEGLAGTATSAAGAVTSAAAGVSPVNCSVSAGVPSAVTSAVPKAVTDAVPSQVTDTVNGALKAVGDTTGVNLGVNGTGTTAVGCSGDTSAATSAAGTAANVAGNVVGTAGNVAGNVAGTATNVVGNVAGTAGTTVNGVTGTVTDTVNEVTGTVSGLLGGTNCSASGGASTGLLGSVTISGSC